MTDLNLAKKDIQKIQNKLQQELNLEQQRTKTNETKYVQRLQEETEKHQSELNAMRHTMKVSVQNQQMFYGKTSTVVKIVILLVMFVLFCVILVLLLNTNPKRFK